MASQHQFKLTATGYISKPILLLEFIFPKIILNFLINKFLFRLFPDYKARVVVAVFGAGENWYKVLFSFYLWIRCFLVYTIIVRWIVKIEEMFIWFESWDFFIWFLRILISWGCCYLFMRNYGIMFVKKKFDVSVETC